MSARLITWLMRPRVRRFRRWSFVLTVPVAVFVGRAYGYEHGVLVIGARVGLWLAVAVWALRLGGERGDAVRDLLMHPRARAILRTELDLVTVLPRLLLARRTPGTTYHRATYGLALAFAFTPMVVAEGALLHLLIRHGWIAWMVTALHAYALLWIWGFALGPNAYPHRIGARAAVLRSGALYRVQVPLCAIATATARRERVGEATERDGAMLLPARGRVDVWLELTEPVRVQRPMRDALFVHRIAVASDEPDALVDRLLCPSHARGRDLGGLAIGLELVTLAREAA
jgi:hypothetical protein